MAWNVYESMDLASRALKVPGVCSKAGFMLVLMLVAVWAVCYAASRARKPSGPMSATEVSSAAKEVS